MRGINRITKVHWLILAAIILVASLVRVSMVTGTVVKYPIRADATDYYFYAANLKYFGVYSKKQFSSSELTEVTPPPPDALRPPGYSLFILPFVEYPPSLSMIRKIQYSQVALSIATLLLVFFALRPFISTYINLGIAALLAASPHLLSMNVYILTESLFTFLVALLVFVFSLENKIKPLLWAFLIGVVVGLGALVRPTLLYLVPFIVLVFVLFKFRGKPFILAFFVVFGFLVIYSPWLVRNQVVELEPTGSLASISVSHGLYPGLMYQDNPKTFGYPYRADPLSKEYSKDMTSVLDEIRSRVIENPLKYAHWYLIGKPLMFLSWGIIQGQGDVFIYPVSASPMLSSKAFGFLHMSSWMMHWPMILLASFAVAGVCLPAVRRNIDASGTMFIYLLGATFFYFVAVHVVANPLPRYSIPLKPVIYALAAIGLQVILTFVLARGGKSSPNALNT